VLKIAAGASAFEAVPPAFGEVVVAAAAAVVDIAAAAAAAAVVAAAVGSAYCLRPDADNSLSS